MNTLIEEMPQLLISICLLVVISALVFMKSITIADGEPVITLVAAYWLGNGAQRLAIKSATQSPPSPPSAPGV